MQGKWEPKRQWTIEAAAPPLSPHRRLESYFSARLSSWRRWHLLRGASLFLLGLTSLWAAAAFVAPPVAMEMLLIVAGAVTLVAVLRTKDSPDLASSLPPALIPLATGAYLLGFPSGQAPNLALVFAAYFTASGIAAIVLSVAHRRRLCRQWEWLVVSGVASLIMAVLILSGLPGPFTWMFGVLLGVEFMFGGSAFIALALALDEVQPGPFIQCI